MGLFYWFWSRRVSLSSASTAEISLHQMFQFLRYIFSKTRLVVVKMCTFFPFFFGATVMDNEVVLTHCRDDHNGF